MKKKRVSGSSKIQLDESLPQAVLAEGMSAGELDRTGPLAQADAALIYASVHRNKIPRPHPTATLVMLSVMASASHAPRLLGDRRATTTTPDAQGVRHPCPACIVAPHPLAGARHEWVELVEQDGVRLERGRR